ncbi:hypothetical protein [Bradyrhizobium iriomotense]|uniref:hypothetical protein n=1 Tax=Bradyrhizobium iriomotense TaxID=441950 RepID=UPI0024E163D6|nr:hypothetical protein [Bradyrhizobium iriomotense]
MIIIQHPAPPVFGRSSSFDGGGLGPLLSCTSATRLPSFEVDPIIAAISTLMMIVSIVLPEVSQAPLLSRKVL